MSLKIKVPPKSSVDVQDIAQSSVYEQQPSRRRVAAKRRIADSDEEEEGEEGDSFENQTQATAVPDSPDYRESSPVDILTNDFSNSPPLTRHASEAPSQASGSTSTVPTKRTKQKAGEDKSRPSKKRRAAAAAYTDSEDEFAAAVAPDDDLDDWELEDKGKRGGVKKGKAKATGSGGVAKGKKAAPSAVKRGKGKVIPGEEGEETPAPMEGIDDAAEDPTPAPSAASAIPPQLKKRKLPTIKKIKPGAGGSAAPTTASTTPTATSATPNNATSSVLAELGREAKTSSRKIPAQLGNADLDLMNANVYKDLFGTGGNASRSVMSRREKEEERRKELNKMREEAKAKRLAEATPSFDLQRQADKIARFDEFLRSKRSNALWPNFLAAKWREVMDKEKEQKEREQRREREGGWQMNLQSQAKGWGTPGDRKEAAAA